MSAPQSSHRMEAKLNTVQYIVFYVFVKRERERDEQFKQRKIIDVVGEKNDFVRMLTIRTTEHFLFFGVESEPVS